MQISGLKPVVHLENMGTVEFLQQHRTVGGYQKTIEGLARVALTGSQAWRDGCLPRTTNSVVPRPRGFRPS
jgi:hypothetical protein